MIVLYKKREKSNKKITHTIEIVFDILYIVEFTPTNFILSFCFTCLKGTCTSKKFVSKEILTAVVQNISTFTICSALHTRFHDSLFDKIYLPSLINQ